MKHIETIERRLAGLEVGTCPVCAKLAAMSDEKIDRELTRLISILEGC